MKKLEKIFLSKNNRLFNFFHHFILHEDKCITIDGVMDGCECVWHPECHFILVNVYEFNNISINISIHFIKPSIHLTTLWRQIIMLWLNTGNWKKHWSCPVMFVPVGSVNRCVLCIIIMLNSPSIRHFGEE